jgi:hypothetical protein
MDSLDLARLQAVEAEHQMFSLEESGLVKLVGFGSDMVAVMHNVSWHCWRSFLNQNAECRRMNQEN